MTEEILSSKDINSAASGNTAIDERERELVAQLVEILFSGLELGTPCLPS